MTNTRVSNALFYGWVVVGVCALLGFVGFGIQNSYGVFFKALEEQFAWTRAQTSSVYALYQILVSIFGIIYGWATDRYGPRITGAIGGVSIGAGLLLTSQVGELWQILITYSLLVAMGVSVAWVPVMATISRWFTARRGMALGIVAAGVGLGTMAIPASAGFLIETVGWRWAYITLGIFAFIFITGVSQLLRRSPEDKGLVAYGEQTMPHSTLPAGVQGTGPRQALGSPRFWVLFAMFLCVCFGTFMIMAHVVRHAQDKDIPPLVAAGILTAIGGSSVAGKLTLGTLADRIGPGLALCASVIPLGFSMVWLPSIDSTMGFYVFGIVFGFFYGGWIPLFPALTAKYFGVRHMGILFGLVTLGAGIGSATGPFFGGYVFDTTGSYSLAFTVGAAMCFVCGGLYPLLRRL